MQSLPASLRSLVRRVAPPTTGRVDGRSFLALGAAVGVVGWSVTQALAWGVVPGGPTGAAALWVGLVGVMATVGGTQCPDAVRFSRPLAVWGATNGTATAVSLLAVARPGTVPAVAVVGVWLGSFLVGYAATAWVVAPEDAGPYRLGTALAAAGLLALLVVPATVLPAGYLLAGVVHALPLVLAVR